MAEAAALLQMPELQVRALAQIQFVLSRQVAALLDAMPQLVRRLATTTVNEEEWSVDRVRGPIQWAPILSGRLTTGLLVSTLRRPPAARSTPPRTKSSTTPCNSSRPWVQRTG